MCGRGRRAAWGALLAVVWVTVGSALAQPGAALAQPDIALAPAPDGSLIVVGNGWRPSQRLVVSVGRDVYPVFVDSAGGFEVATGQTGPIDQPLGVHRLDVGAAPAMARLDVDARAPSVPNALAVSFAEGVATGAAWLGVLLAGFAGIALVRRRYG